MLRHLALIARRAKSGFSSELVTNQPLAVPLGTHDADSFESLRRASCMVKSIPRKSSATWREFPTSGSIFFPTGMQIEAAIQTNKDQAP
jgi:hypothetical protein